MNKQRMVIYEQRRRVLEGEDLSEEVEELDRGGRRATSSTRSPRASPARSGTSTALAQRDGALYGRRDHRRRAARGGRALDREALIEEFAEDARDEYDGEGGGARSRASADARARALHRPPGRRHALARAPREHGLPPRGRPPARDGAEGSARRVHGRGPRDVRGARTRRSARRSCCTSSTPSSRPERGRRQQLPADADAPTATSSTSTRRSRAPTRSRPRAAGDGRSPRRVPPPRRRRTADRAHERAREARPQRPVLVRLGQEVQEVPRRLPCASRSPVVARSGAAGDCRLASVTIGPAARFVERSARVDADASSPVHLVRAPRSTRAADALERLDFDARPQVARATQASSCASSRPDTKRCSAVAGCRARADLDVSRVHRRRAART